MLVAMDKETKLRAFGELAEQADAGEAGREAFQLARMAFMTLFEISSLNNAVDHLMSKGRSD